MKEKILNYFKPGGQIIPTYVAKRIRNYYILAFVILAIGLVLLFITKMLEALGLTGVFFILCLFYGYFMHLQYSKEGVDIMDATCIQVDYGSFGVKQVREARNKPKRYLVVDNYDIVYALPYETLYPKLFEGAKVRVYIEKKTNYREARDGITIIPGLIGYEITGATKLTEE
ncbi:MAG: hypothetical protein IK121_01400 [Lachnospiraceae bacterium]|nr:hypothetical protein [Lachnospiraceae bacterium]